MAKEKEMNPSSQMVFDMAKIFLDIQTSSFESGMKHAKEDAEQEQKMQDFADKCERDIGEKPNKTMCCSECGNDDIEWRVWADENNEISGGVGDKEVYCNDCEDETRPVAKDKPNE